MLIGFTYEADIHCAWCARHAFGHALGLVGTDEGPTDREGNPVREYTDDDIRALTDDRGGVSCGTCRDLIEEAEDIIEAEWDDRFDRERTYHVYGIDDDEALPGFDWAAVRRTWIDESRYEYEARDLDEIIDEAVTAYGEDILRLCREQEAATYETDLIALAS